MKKIKNLLTQAIYFISLIPFSIIALVMFFISSKAVFTDKGDGARIVLHSNYLSYFSLLILVYLLFLKLKTSKTTKIHKYFILSLIIKLIVVFSFPIKYYYDMGFYMETFAKNMLDSFSLNYGFNVLSYYFFNIPLVFIYTIYIKIIGYEYAFYIGYLVNILMMLLIELAIYKISKLLFNQKIAIFAYKISIMFIPFYSFLPIVYNDVLAVGFFMWAIYFFISYLQTKKIIALISYLVLISIGIILRNVGSIIVLASIIYLIIYHFKQSLIIISALIFLLISFNNPKNYDYVYDKLNIYNQAGVSHVNIINYLAIGISNGVDNQSPGYYYPFDLELFNYLDNYYVLDQLAYNKRLIKFIKTRINELGFFGLIKHYLTKFLLTWTDGFFEGNLFLNFIPNKNQSPIKYYYQNKLHQLTTNYYLYETINTYVQAFYHLIMITITFKMLKYYRNIKITLNFFKLIILGVMAFYLLLETASHYVFLSLPLIIILFSAYFNDFKD